MRQAGLGAVERLDLRFLVDRDDDGMDRRVHVEADDIFDLFGEGRVVGRLEGADPVGLKMVRLPDALHRAQADAGRLGDHAARPMGGLSGRLAARQRQDFGHRRRRQRFLAGLARLVAQQPVDTLLGEALLPSPYRRPAGAALARHRQHRQGARPTRERSEPAERVSAAGCDRRRSQPIACDPRRREGYRRSVPCPENRTARTRCESYVCVSALALGVGLAVTAQAHGTLNRQSAVPGTDMQAGASAPSRHVAPTRHHHSRQQVMHIQRMLRAQGFYTGHIDGVMSRRTQMAVARAQHQQKGPRRVAALHKAHRPATTGKEIGIGSSMPNKRDTMSGSSTITPTPIIPPITEAPNAGSSTDQKTAR